MIQQSHRKLAVICDFAEEAWPSMDLVAEKLVANAELDRGAVQVAQVRGVFQPRLGRLPFFRQRRSAFNADRVLNRMYDYPRHLRRLVPSFDWFHVADHSYANVVHSLPARQTGVFCHDLDTFRCVIAPGRDPRPRWFKEMARHILTGMQKAALVFYTTSIVRAEIERHGLLDPSRLVQARYGIAEEFHGCPREPEPPVQAVLDRLQGRPFLLHVGSCIPRKRIDVLIDVFAEVRREHPHLVLLQVGGEWTEKQWAQLSRHGVAHAVWQLPRMNQAEVAALYARAALVLMPSEAEGFGLPVVEALACGTRVVASDIPVFREVGGPAAIYCPLANIESWSRTVGQLITDDSDGQERAARLEWTRQFSWQEYAARIVSAYSRIS